MFDVGVHAAVAEEAEQMELAGAAAFHGFAEQRLALEFAAGDELVNARDVHVHDAAGADIQMADFAIAHLSFGEADGGAGGVNERVGKFAAGGDRNLVCARGRWRCRWFRRGSPSRRGR